MASIDRTAYPRFKRVVSAREVAEAFAPTSAEAEWARGRTQTDQHFLALVVLVKCYQRLGYFPKIAASWRITSRSSKGPAAPPNASTPATRHGPRPTPWSTRQSGPAIAHHDQKTPVKRNRFVQLSRGTRMVNRALEAKARALAGVKGYVTNLAACPTGHPSPPSSSSTPATGCSKSKSRSGCPNTTCKPDRFTTISVIRSRPI